MKAKVFLYVPVKLSSTKKSQLWVFERVNYNDGYARHF